MWIKKVALKHFRCFRKLEAEGFGRLNLIAGQNNSGKTALLEGILAATFPQHPATWNMLAEKRGFNHGSKDFFGQFFYNLDGSQTIMLKSYFSLELKEQEIQSQVSAYENVIDFEGLVIDIPHNHYDQDGNWSQKIETVSVNMGDKNPYRQASDAQLPNPPRNFHFLKHLTKSNYLDYISKAIENGEEDKIINTLKQVDDRINSIDILKGDKLVIGQKGLKKMPLEAFGDGVAKLVAFMSEFFQGGQQLIFVDEIENGLHYSAQKHLWHSLLEACRHTDSQIFATTHSYECIRAFAEVAKATEAEEEMQYMRLDDLGDHHQVTVYPFDVLEFATEQNAEVR